MPVTLRVHPPQYKPPERDLLRQCGLHACDKRYDGRSMRGTLAVAPMGCPDQITLVFIGHHRRRRHLCQCHLSRALPLVPVPLHHQRPCSFRTVPVLPYHRGELASRWFPCLQCWCLVPLPFQHHRRGWRDDPVLPSLLPPPRLLLLPEPAVLLPPPSCYCPNLPRCCQPAVVRRRVLASPSPGPVPAPEYDPLFFFIFFFF